MTDQPVGTGAANRRDDLTVEPLVVDKPVVVWTNDENTVRLVFRPKQDFYDQWQHPQHCELIVERKTAPDAMGHDRWDEAFEGTNFDTPGSETLTELLVGLLLSTPEGEAYAELYNERFKSDEGGDEAEEENNDSSEETE